MFTKPTIKYSLKTFGLIFSFILIYSTTGILLAKQVALFNNTKNIQVKESAIALPEVGHITNDGTVEPLQPTNDKPTITTYTVAQGDTVESIAKKFDISSNTVRFANDLTKKSILKVGQKLIILPVTGIEYTVQKGDTLSTIAKRFHADATEIISFNDIESAKIKIGDKIIIPNAEPLSPTKDIPVEKTSTLTKTSQQTKKISTPAKVAIEEKITPTTTTVDTPDGTDEADDNQEQKPSTYFIHPVPGSRLSQGLHGYNGVDFAAPTGTPILAAADGVVIVEKGAGKWYGGYGNYIVVEHENGTQTLYSHNSKNLVTVGDIVKQGQTIGLIGSTGRSTGPHLHFEVRGGKNPWVGNKKGTTY